MATEGLHEVLVLRARQHVAGGVGHANRKHLAPLARVHKRQGKMVAQKGLVGRRENEATKINDGRSTTNSIKPDLQDFDAVKMDYCRKHQIDIAQLNARLASDNRLAAELFRLAQAATLSVGRAGVPRRGSGSGEYSS
jgi:hypothetical protein